MGTYDATVLKMAVKLMEKYPGETPVCFFCADTKKRIFAPEHCWIREENGILRDLEAVFGKNNVKFN